MNDLVFPLTYTTWGSIATTKTEAQLHLTHARHILNTIAKERILFPDFGLRVDFLFDLPVPTLIAEQVRSLLQAYISTLVDVQASIITGNKITITVLFPENPDLTPLELTLTL